MPIAAIALASSTGSFPHTAGVTAVGGGLSRRLIAAEAIQTCQTCAVDKTDVGVKAPILRSWRQAWRITCPVCRSLMRAMGQGSVTSSEDDPPSLVSWEEVLEGERLLDDYAERGIQTWASPIDLLRLLLIRRDPKPIDPERWIETPKVLDLVIPGFDRLVAATGTSIPPADRPILPLLLRPALLAGIAIVERLGPKSSPNSMVGRSAPTTPISEPLRPGSSCHTTLFLEFIYAAYLRFWRPRISCLAAVMIATRRNLTFKCSATSEMPVRARVRRQRVHP